MIRSRFNLEPEKLSKKRWAQLFNEAEYLRRLEARTLAEVLAAVLGGKKEE